MKKFDVKNIKNGKFIKKLNNEDLEILGDDIREFLIDNISKTGGHLSSNLGIVDLTIALHKEFDFMDDKIVFDVGHQSYTHKILTNRAKEFETLRQYKGLSGFQSLSEGDNYEAGHSSTSLSAGLGFAISRDLSNKKHNVIAVIGDASISNGLSYEALNHIGATDTKLIVILNDNEMSISKNVGAFHNFLDSIRSTYKYNNTKTKTKTILLKIPVLGKIIINLIKVIKDFVKNLYIKEGTFFENLGFKYLGPINGHDYKEMEEYLKIAKKSTTPVLLHVITKKGKGYKFAEEDTLGVWHGVGAFDKSTGKLGSKTIWADAIANKVYNCAKKDKKILVITPAMSGGSKLNEIKKDLNKQFFDVGIAEEHALVFANSLAIDNKKPVVFIYSSFLQRGYDQIVHDIAKMNKSVVVMIDRAGIIGEDGASHQGLFDISFLLPIPNITIASPSNVMEANALVTLALKSETPFFIRYSKNKVELCKDEANIKYKTWERLSTGEDGTIITYGDFVNNAMEIKEILEKKNKHIEVINARFIKPIDEIMFNSITNKNIFVYEESMKIGSLGSFLNSKKPVEIIAVEDAFVAHGSRDEILKELKLDPKFVADYIYKKI